MWSGRLSDSGTERRSVSPSHAKQPPADGAAAVLVVQDTCWPSTMSGRLSSSSSLTESHDGSAAVSNASP